MYNPVPRNALQNRLNASRLNEIAPDPYSDRTTTCVIEKVYDTDVLLAEGIPDTVAGGFLRSPGRLYARVLLPDKNTRMILPFHDLEDQIYSTYGNGVLLEGRNGIISYRNNDIGTGTIVPTRVEDSLSLSTKQMSRTYDIIKIV